MPSNIVVAANVLQAQIEKVRDKLQVYLEQSDQIAGLVKKAGDVETISDKLYRIPIQLFIGGSYQKFDADAGDMGGGSGMKLDKLTAGYIYTNYAIEVSDRANDTTATAGQAIVKAFAKQLSSMMDEIKVYDDIVFHGDGTGKLTNSGSAYGSSGWSGGDTMTFAAATDYLGVGKLRPGMVVSVWDTTGATKRATSVTPLQIDHIDWANKVVYFNGTITAGANTDILCIANLTTDTTAQSFQSTWPLSGDTFRHGMYYANDATTTNYYLGQLKSAITELLPNRVNAQGASLTFQQGLLMLDQIIMRRDAEATKGMIGIAHMAQRAAVMNLGIAINNWNRGQSDKMLDLMPNNIGYGDTFDYCGIKCYLSKRQDRSRIDFITPKNWGRAELFDTKFHEVGGKSVFEGRTSTGNLKASQLCYVKQAYDFVCYDPGAGGMIDTLGITPGYGN